MLTPASVMDLRTSVKWRVSNGTHADIPCHLQYSTSEDAWMLYVQGRIMAIGPLDVVAFCAISERQEPGFITRILDPATPADIAALGPSAASAERQRREREAAAQRAHAARERAQNEAREMSPLTASRITLDDLF